MNRTGTTMFILWVIWCCAGTAVAQTVTVDGAVEHQTIQGGGTTFNAEGDPYPIPLEDVAEQVYDLGFRLMRMEHGDFLEITNDDADPQNFNWTSFNQQLAAADEVLRVAKVMQDAGILMWTETLNMPPWLETADGLRLDPSYPNAYEEMGEYWAAFLTYAQTNFGVDFPYLSLQNEPDCNVCWTGWTAAQLRDGIKAIGARLAAEGIGTQIITPNNMFAGSSRTYLQTILADAVAAGYLAANVYHAYDSSSIYNGPDVIINQIRAFAADSVIQASGLPIWETEWSLWYDKRNEAYAGTLRYGLDMAKFFHNCYAEGQTSIATSVEIAYARDLGIFGPGLANGGLAMKKEGHATTQYHRFIEPGSIRIDTAVSGASNLFVTAFKHPANGALVLVMLNRGTSAVTATVNLNNLTAPASLRAVRTSATEDSAELGRVNVTGGSFSATLPGESITTYIGSTTADTTPPGVPGGVAATALSDTLVRLTWNPGTDDVKVAGYKVFRDGGQIGWTNGTSYVDHGLSGQTAYAYTVSAFDLAGNESAQSAPASVTTPADTIPPAVPRHVVATPRPGAVMITWDPSVDSVTDHDLSGFRVHRGDTAGGPYTQLIDLNDPAATGYEDATVSNSQAYYYVVTSYDDETPVNESAYSNESGTTPDPRLPGGLPGDYCDAGRVDQDGTMTWEWFETFISSRVDPVVDFDWGVTPAPAGRDVRGAWCLFGARWQGEVLADHAETYTFEVQNLDGARLWIDGVLVIDDWHGWFTRTNSAPIALSAGWHALRLDYYRYHPDAGENGVIRLYYSSPSTARQIIPADHLATVAPCTPDCLNKQCGPDGCGDVCGTCTAPFICNAQGQCVCPQGLQDCSGQCVNTATDPDNCGSCGNACAQDQVCNQGSCESQCTGGLTRCGQSCVDLNTDPDNCGSCGNVCGQNEQCSSGQCVCTPDCDGKQCGDDGCGGSCGDCGAGETCENNQCVAGCPDIDGDGFAGEGCGGTDCDDDDPGINPDAEDVCGDGIDQDCSGSDEECGKPEGGCDCGQGETGSLLVLLVLLGLLARRNP